MSKTVGPAASALCALPMALVLAGCPAFVHDDYEFGDAPSRSENICAEDETSFGQRCYFVTESLEDYDAALRHCADRGAGWSLVEVGSPEEHAFVGDVADGEEAWLGATDRESEGEWVWNSGAPLWQGDETGSCLADFCQWDDAEPNDTGDCLRMVDDRWRDTPCDESHIAVCEAQDDGL